MDVQQEHTVNVEGVGQANSLTRTSRVHCTAFKCSVKGDLEKQAIAAGAPAPQAESWR